MSEYVCAVSDYIFFVSDFHQALMTRLYTFWTEKLYFKQDERYISCCIKRLLSVSVPLLTSSFVAISFSISISHWNVPMCGGVHAAHEVCIVQVLAYSSIYQCGQRGARDHQARPCEHTYTARDATNVMEQELFGSCTIKM